MGKKKKKKQKKANKRGFKLYKNRRTKYHPAIEISNDNKTWKNLEVTKRPTKHGRYIELKDNPNPDQTDKAYVRKFVRNDPIRTRGQLLKKYRITERDLIEIEKFIKKNKKS